MKTWIKLYTEINRDPDIGTLTWAQRGIWSALLALAGEIDDRDEDEQETGMLDTIDRVAWSIRCDVDELAEAMQAFEARGMVEIDDDVLYLPNYSKRQEKYRESKEAVRARVRRHRAKKNSPIFERDNWTCRYCGRRLELTECTIDHIIPVSQGGREDDDNLVTACSFCNTSKGARTPEEAGLELLPLGNAKASPPKTGKALRNAANGYVTLSDTDTEADTEADTEKIKRQRQTTDKRPDAAVAECLRAVLDLGIREPKASQLVRQAAANGTLGLLVGDLSCWIGHYRATDGVANPEGLAITQVEAGIPPPVLKVEPAMRF